MARKLGSSFQCACGDHAWAYLTKGYTVLVSSADQALLSDCKWHATVRRRGHVTVYVKNSAGEFIHRAIMRPDPGDFVDHVSHDPLDNRRPNLRLASRSENGANHRKRKNTSSKYIGVTLHEGRAWQARIQKDGKAIYLGLYPTEDDAAQAYRRAAEELHGAFAAG